MKLHHTQISLHLIKEWHYEKNNPLLPENFSPNSHKKVWWRCDSGHEWEATIAHRNNGRGCPFCAGKRVQKGINDLATVCPQLVNEWHYEKNATFLPSDFLPQSNKKVWWRCESGHEWEASISHRYNGRGCPYCSGKRVLAGFNDLMTTHKALCLEWDFDKNKSLFPHMVSKGSDKLAWWKCQFGHSWRACISSRASNGIGCPTCAKGRQTSFPEKAVFYYLNKYIQDVVPNYKTPELGFFEIDIYIPRYHIGVEYDGEMWHNDVYRDLLKNELCKNLGIKLIRIREPLCPELSDGISHNIIIKNKKTGVKDAIISLLDCIQQLSGLQFDFAVDLLEDNANILSLMLTTFRDKNIASTHSELLKEWDFEKNGNIKPETITSGSDKKVWWLCPNNHSYITSVSNRTRGRGCPICSGKKVLKGFNDLESQYPELAKEWDAEKNSKRPDEVTFGSDALIWWRCAKGHSYKATVNNRRAGNSCPYCSGKKVLTGFNDVAHKHPKLLVEWDYDKNDIKPTEVTPGSHKEVYWKCDVCDHKWKSAVYYRCLLGFGCPSCRKLHKNT